MPLIIANSNRQMFKKLSGNLPGLGKSVQLAIRTAKPFQNWQAGKWSVSSFQWKDKYNFGENKYNRIGGIDVINDFLLLS